MQLKVADEENDYLVSVLGDLDCDGNANQVELTSIIRNIANSERWKIAGNKRLAADLTCDSQINVKDVDSLVKYIVYEELEIPQIKPVLAPSVEVIEGELIEDQNCYTGEVTVKITENEQNAIKTMYKIEGETEQGYIIYESTNTIKLNVDGIYKISAYTYGKMGNRSEINFIIFSIGEELPQNADYKTEYYTEELDGTYKLNNTITSNGIVGTNVTAVTKEYKGFTLDTSILETKQNGEISLTDELILKLYYRRNEYSILLNAGENIASVNGTGTYKHGQLVNIYATINNIDGYTVEFTKWESDDIELLENSNSISYSFVMPAGNITLTALAIKNKNSYNYSVEYYYDGIIDSTKTVNSQSLFESEITTYTDKNITGYKLDKVEGIPLTITSTSANNVIKVYYEKNDFDYTVNYYYDGIKDESKTVVSKQKYNSTISNYIEKNITGYELDKVEGLPIIISEVVDNNFVSVYYKAKEYKLTYNLNGGNLVETLTNPISYKVTTPDFSINNPVKQGYTFTGWTLTKLNGETQTPGTAQITQIISTGSIGDREYTANWIANTDTQYKVEHYKEKLDGSYELSDTETLGAQTDTNVSANGKTYTGFTLNTSILGTKISDIVTADGNLVLKLYYTRNSYSLTLVAGENIESVSGTGEYKYEQNINILAVLQELDGHNVVFTKWTSSNPAILADIFEVTKQITMPASEITLTATATKIKNNYNYSVEYYYDGIINNTKTVSNQSQFGNEISTYVDENITGYKLDKVEGLPLIITSTVSNNVIKVFYNKDSFEYNINYFYDGVKDTEKTQSANGIYNSIISTSDILTKIDTNIISGYEFDRVEGTPLTIKENISNNQINIYYKTIQYDLSYVLNDGTVTVDNNTSYKVTTPTFTLNNPTREGYTFTGWTLTKLNGVEQTSGTPQVVQKIVTGTTGDREYTANWIANTDTHYKVNHYKEKLDGTYQLETTETLGGVTDTEVTATVKIYSGFTFDTSVVGTKQVGTITSDGKLELNLYYKRNLYTLTLVAGENIASVLGSGTYKYEQPVNISAILQYSDGFTVEFVGWHSDEPGILPNVTENNKQISMPIGNVTLTASATKITNNYNFTVEYYYDEIIDNEKTVITQAKFGSEISTYTDKNITGYYLDRVEGIPLIITSTSANNLIKVYYEKMDYDYIINYYYNGLIDTSKKETKTEKYSNIVTTYPDKVIAGYELDKVEGVPLTISDNQNNNVINIYYKLIQYDLSYILNEGIVEVDNTSTYNVETSTFTLNNPIKEGYLFTGWTLTNLDGEEQNPGIPQVDQVIEQGTTGDREYTANWVANTDTQYKVEHYKEQLDGTYLKADTDILGGITNTTVIASEKTYEGFTLDKTVTGTIESGIITPDGQLTLKLYYTRDSYTLTLVAGENIASVNGAGLYKYDQEVNISAVLQHIDGYTVTFDKWNSDLPEILANITEKEKTFKMPIGNIALTASAIKTINNYNYSIEYYYDGVKNTEKTQIQSAEFDSSILTSDITTNVETNMLTGYELDNIDGTPLKISETLTNNIINVYYKAKSYNLSYVLNEGSLVDGETNPSTYKVTSSDIILNNPTREGYTFTGWTLTKLNGEIQTPGTAQITQTIFKGTTGNREYTANWIANDDTQYKVEHYKEQLDGTYLKADTDILGGTTNTTVIANEKTYEGFTLDKTVTGTVESGIIISNGQLILKLYYTRNSYTLSLVAGENIASVSGAGKFKYEQEVDISAMVDEAIGYTTTFSIWESGTPGLLPNIITEQSQQTIIMPLGDITLTAKADRIVKVYTLTLNVGTNVKSISNGETTSETSITKQYDFGTQINISAELQNDEGYEYEFTCWKSADENIISDQAAQVAIVGMPNANVTLTAMATKKKKDYGYTINYYYDGVLDTSKTETGNSQFASTIYYNTSKALNKVITGYEVDTITPASLVISSTSANNVMEVYYVATNYNIDYVLNDGVIAEGESNPSSYKVTTSTFTLNNPTKAGYLFTGWTLTKLNDEATTGEISQEIVTINNGSTGKREYTANWQADTDTAYKVNHYLEQLDGKYKLEETENLVGETSKEVSAISKSYDGFTYDGTIKERILTGDPVMIAPETKTQGIVAPDGTLELSLYYTRNSYTLALVAGENIASVSGAGTYKYGQEIQIDAQLDELEGYTISWLKWISEDTSKVENQSIKNAIITMPASDVSLTANTTKTVKRYIYYIEFFYDEVSDSTRMKQLSAAYGTEITLSSIQSKIDENMISGYELDRTENVPSIIAVSPPNLVIKIYYKSINYNINYILDGGELGASNLLTYKVTTPSFTLNNPTKLGYTFNGWELTKLNDVATTGETLQTSAIIEKGSTGNREYTARWIADTDTSYTVKHYKEKLDGTYDVPDEENFIGETGTTVNAESRTYEGFTFDESVEGTVQSGIIAPDGSLVLSLYYTRNRYDLTLVAGENIASVSGAGNYKYGEQVSISAELDSTVGYITQWTNWTSSDTTKISNKSTKNTNVTIPDSDITLTANATIKKDKFNYSIKYYYDNELDETKTVTKKDEYQNIVITYEDKVIPGYELDRVDNIPLEISPNEENNVISVYYKLINYTITYNLDGGELAEGTINQETFNLKTPKFTLNNPVKTEFTFTGWTGSNGETPQQAVEVDTSVIGNKEYNANWTTTTYTITIHHYEEGTGVEGIPAVKIVEDEIIVTPTGVTYQTSTLLSESNVLKQAEQVIETPRNYIDPNKYVYMGVMRDEINSTVDEFGTINGTVVSLDQDITYYYHVNTNLLTAEVIGGNGQLTNSSQNVRYGENSAEIVCTPNNGYKVDSIRMYSGEEIDGEYDNEDGSDIKSTCSVENLVYTIPEMSNFTENKHIVVKYKVREFVAQITAVPSGTEEMINTTDSELILGHTYYTLEEAINDAYVVNSQKSPDSTGVVKIKLLDDVDNESNSIQNGNNIEIDLNGFRITSYSNIPALSIDEATLVVQDTSVLETGKVISSKGVGIWITPAGSLTLGNNNSQISQTAPTVQGVTYGVYKEKDNETNEEGIFKFFDGQILGQSAAVGGSSLIDETPSIYDPYDQTVTVENVISQRKTLQVISGVEAVIGKSRYPTIEQAFHDVITLPIYTSDTTVEIDLVSDAIVEDIIDVTSINPLISKNIILDLNGHSIVSSTATSTISNSEKLQIIDSGLPQEELDNPKVLVQNGTENTETGDVYGFRMVGDHLESDNTGIQSSTASSYIEIDLTDKPDTQTFTVAVDAISSCQNNYDWMYATITNTTEMPTEKTTEGRFMHKSDISSLDEYTTTIQGGSVYYLHICYYKNESMDSYLDCAKIYGITLDGIPLLDELRMKTGKIVNSNSSTIINSISGELTISGGIIRTSKSATNTAVIINENILNVDGGTTNYNKNIINNIGNLQINGGSIISDNVYTKLVNNSGILVTSNCVLSTYDTSGYAIYNYDLGEVTINEGTQIGCIINETKSGYGIYNIGTKRYEEGVSNPAVKINGGIIKSSFVDAITQQGTGEIVISGENVSIESKYNLGIKILQDGKVTLNNGLITTLNNQGVYIEKGIFEMNDGRIDAKSNGISNSSNSYSQIIINGGIIESKQIGIQDNISITPQTADRYSIIKITGKNETRISGTTYGISYNTGSLEVGTEGGEPNNVNPLIEATGTSGIGIYNKNGTFNFFDGKIVGITGKSISGVISKQESGYDVVKTINENGKEEAILQLLPVVKVEKASIDTDNTSEINIISDEEFYYFYSIGDAAYCSINEGSTTITLLRDITYIATHETEVIPVNKNIILDINGNSIIGTDAKSIRNEGTFEIIDSLVGTIATIKQNNGTFIENVGEFNINQNISYNMLSTGEKNIILNLGEMNINDCLFTTTGTVGNILNKGELNIINGTFNSNRTTSICIDNEGILNIENGIFKDIIKNNGNGIIRIHNGTFNSLIDNSGVSVFEEGVSEPSILITGGIFQSSTSNIINNNSSGQVIIRKIGEENISITNNVSGNSGSIVNSGTGEIILDGVDIYTGNNYCIDNLNVDGYVTIKSGIFKVSSGVVIRNKGNMIIDGGDFTGSIENSAKFTLNDGKISGLKIDTIYSGTASAGQMEMNIFGGIVEAKETGKSAIRIGKETILTIGKNDGILNDNAPIISSTGECAVIAAYTGIGTINYYDGIVSGKGSAIEGAITGFDNNNQIISTKVGEIHEIRLGNTTGVAYIGEDSTTTYNTLMSAIVACTGTNDTITLIKDICVATGDEIQIDSTKNITINLNNHEIIGYTINTIFINNGTFNLTETNENGTGLIRQYSEIGIKNNGTLIISGGTIESRRYTQHKIIDNASSSDLNIIGGTLNLQYLKNGESKNNYAIYSNTSANINFTGGTIYLCNKNAIVNTYENLYGICVENTDTEQMANVTMSGNAKIEQTNNGVRSYGICIKSNGNINVTGGTFIGTSNIEYISLDSGTLNMTGGSIVAEGGSGIVGKAGTIINFGGTANISMNNNIAITTKGELNIFGGTISADTGVLVNDSTGQVNISEGNITCSSYGINIGMNSKVIITKANINQINLSNSGCGINVSGQLILGVNDNKLTNDLIQINANGTAMSIGSRGNVYYYDGRLHGDVLAISGQITEKSYIFDIISEDEDKTKYIGVIQVTEAVVKVGSSYANSFADAITTIVNTGGSGIIELQRNLVTDTSIVIPESVEGTPVSITIDLNGNNIRWAGTEEPGIINNSILSIINSSEDGSDITQGATLQNDGGLVVMNKGTLKIGDDSDGVVYSNSPRLQGLTYAIDNTTSGATVYLYDGILKGIIGTINGIVNYITSISGYSQLDSTELIGETTYYTKTLGN